MSTAALSASNSWRGTRLRRASPLMSRQVRPWPAEAFTGPANERVDGRPARSSSAVPGRFALSGAATQSRRPPFQCSSRMLARFGSSPPALAAVAYSRAGRRPGTGFEDLGEELGSGGDVFLVPGSYAPPQMDDADMNFVAVVTHRGVNEGARVGS